MIIFWIVLGTASQLGLWMAAARFHYRHWKWETPHEEDRRIAAGFWGFLWPLLIVGYSFASLFKLIGWATTTPGLSERKEKKPKLKQERLKELDRQIAVAEHELEEATLRMKGRKQR